MTDILEQLSDAKGALRSFATLKGAFSAAEAAVQAIEAARAEIAALREARDAARDDIPDDAYNVPTGTPEQIAADYAALGLPATPQDDAERDWQAWDAELATPDGQAKLARLATSAAPVRLTRAQMRVLEHVSRHEGGWTQTRSAASVDGALAELSALGYIEATQTSEYREWTLTPLGRAALAAAQRETGDEARNGTGRE